MQSVMNSERLKECTELSKEILKNIELSEVPMKNIILTIVEKIS